MLGRNKNLQVEPGKPGAEVSKKKTISQRKNLPIECAQGDQPLRCPNRGSCARYPWAVPSGGGWLCHVMSCNVICCVFILCDAISCVV